jgi:hypothetical protein
MAGRYDVDLVGDEPEPVAEVGHPDHDGGSRRRVEHQPDRVLARADAQGWISSDGRSVSRRR